MKGPEGWGSRYTVAVMMCLASAVSYAMRFNLSLAIVAMVKRSQHSTAMNLTANCPESHAEALISSVELSKDANIELTEDTGEFDWNEVEQGVILGVFMWGYVASQIPGGILSKRYGGKWPIGIGVLVAGIFSLLTPSFARSSKGLLIFARVVQGLVTGLQFPAQFTMISAWAPPNERSLFAAVAFQGAPLGTALMYIASGYLIGANVMGGWPSVFYMSGIISIIWFVFWCFLVSSTPGEHPTISNKEFAYISKSLGESTAANKQKLPTPWKSILTSLPVWAVYLSHFVHCWGIYSLMSIPTYMKTVLNFDISTNSWMCAYPQLAQAIFGTLFAQVADNLLRRKRLSTVTVRKCAQFVAGGLAAMALLSVGYSGCNSFAAVGLLILAVGLTGAFSAGVSANYIDLSPNHAGVVFSAWNMVANVTGFLAPYVNGIIISGNPSIENWRTVFTLGSCLYFGGTVFYLIFASGEEQKWNSESQSESHRDALDDVVSDSTKLM